MDWRLRLLRPEDELGCNLRIEVRIVIESDVAVAAGPIEQAELDFVSHPIGPVQKHDSEYALSSLSTHNGLLR